MRNFLVSKVCLPSLDSQIRIYGIPGYAPYCTLYSPSSSFFFPQFPLKQLIKISCTRSSLIWPRCTASIRNLRRSLKTTFFPSSSLNKQTSNHNKSNNDRQGRRRRRACKKPQASEGMNDSSVCYRLY